VGALNASGWDLALRIDRRTTAQNVNEVVKEA
jgi:hypothetical protein